MFLLKQTVFLFIKPTSTYLAATVTLFYFKAAAAWHVQEVTLVGGSSQVCFSSALISAKEMILRVWLKNCCKELVWILFKLIAAVHEIQLQSCALAALYSNIFLQSAPVSLIHNAWGWTEERRMSGLVWHFRKWACLSVRNRRLQIISLAPLKIVKQSVWLLLKVRKLLTCTFKVH